MVGQYGAPHQQLGWYTPMTGFGGAWGPCCPWKVLHRGHAVSETFQAVASKLTNHRITWFTDNQNDNTGW